MDWMKTEQAGQNGRAASGVDSRMDQSGQTEDE